MADDVLLRYLRSVPKIMNAQTNPVLNALLQGFSAMDNGINEQLQNTKAQLFVRTAEGIYLDRLANSLGVSRPLNMGLLDADFQNLIPNLSLKAKQVRKTLYDVADVFWGPLFTHANIQTLNFGPFNVSPGDIIQIVIDDGDTQTIEALTGDIATPGAATAQEIVNILSRFSNVTASVSVDPLTSNQFVILRTNTPGPFGSVKILASSMIGSSKLNFPVGKFQLIQQNQRFCIYEIRPNEVVIEIPAIVPALRRTLKGSAHLHADGTLSPPVPPANGIWQGSFIFDPAGLGGSFTVTGQKANTQQNLIQNSVYTSVTVDDTTKIVHQTGFLIFGFGTANQEGPVGYRGIPNSRTILLDPAYVFKKTHTSGTVVNVLSQLTPYVPRTNGQDLAVYLTSPSEARLVTQGILASLVAAGVIVNFVVLLPTYKNLIVNPYA